MSIIYHRIQVNKNTLSIQNPTEEQKKTYSNGSVSDTLPKGTCVGVVFVPYIDSPKNFHEIKIENIRGNLLCSVTSIKDYLHKGGGYFNGFKVLDYLIETNERILITYNTIEGIVSDILVGEFIFIIEQEETCN